MDLPNRHAAELNFFFTDGLITYFTARLIRSIVLYRLHMYIAKDVPPVALAYSSSVNQ